MHQKTISGKSDVTKKIIALFDVNKVDYEIFEHKPVFTSEDASKIRDTNLSMGAKALVLIADKKPMLFVLPGNKKLDNKKVKTHLSIKDLRFAKPLEVEKLTKLTIGSIPPVGNALSLDSYFDISVTKKDMVAFNAGSHTVSIKMKAKDLVLCEKPKVFSFTKD